MRRTWRIGLGLVVVAVVAVGCGDEAPTEVGSELLSEGLRTVQVALSSPMFLQEDTTYGGVGSLDELEFGIAANDFEGELDANLLFTVNRPVRVGYTDPDGTELSDSIVSVQGGRVTVVLDSLSRPEPPIEFAVVDLTEEWDPGSVSWDLRVDTAGVNEPWTTPGGTTGSVLAEATWSAGDTVVLTLDSAAASVWADRADARMGGALQVATPNKRARIESVDFEFDIVPESTDTVLAAGNLVDRASVAPEPPAPADGVLRVGGLPAWRSLLRFTPLDDVMVPCEAGSTTCEIALSEVKINTANLILRTRATGGYRTERPMRLDGRAVLEGPTVPLTRSPLSGPFGQMTDSLDVADFTGAASVVARVPITGFVQRNASLDEGEEPLLWLALTAVGEKQFFGFGEFGGLASTAPPELELVVTIPVRKVAQ